MRGRRRLSTLSGHVEYAERCRTAGVDGVARLRGLGRRDGHVGRLIQRGRGIGLCLVGLGLGPGLFKGQGLGGVGIPVSGDGFGRGIGIGICIGPGAQLITWQRLVPLLIRSLALAIPPLKVIDIHTGRPLGLANKHLLALYPQMTRRLAWNVTKGMSLCRFKRNVLRLTVGDLVSQQEVDRPHDSDAIDVRWMVTILDNQDFLVRIRYFSQHV